jgi:hypothetical protein
MLSDGSCARPSTIQTTLRSRFTHPAASSSFNAFSIFGVSAPVRSTSVATNAGTTSIPEGPSVIFSV